MKDCSQKISSRLGYSIKSELSSKATLLNASSHTDFIYKVESFNPKYINLINSIVTKKKLKDRYNEIIRKGGKIIPIGASSNIFSLNLKCIDGDLESLLVTMLLYSYIYDTKDIKKLIDLLAINNPLKIDISKISSSPNYLKSFYSNKLLKFFNAIAFEMFPSSLMIKSNILSGGMLIMHKGGDISLLDKIYFYDELNKYFLNNLKLDSPSSTRYHMLELKQCSITNEIYFTLNLQIRFK
ncbi:HpaII family restriction endonuclease [Fusobacterium vincentii]|uniref:HpaII family restriction endonuclease n=2 Tax=Fusobacterium vincentii TaxID=155615 RepID=A0ABV3Y906_FUSVC